MKLLKTLCSIHSPSGNEEAISRYLLDYIEQKKRSWKVVPEVFFGEDFQHCIILKFGRPTTAIFAHIDSIGYTVRYEDQLVPIGGPQADSGTLLVGEDSLGPIECSLVLTDNNQLKYKFGRAIDTGTDLTYKSDFREKKDYVT